MVLILYHVRQYCCQLTKTVRTRSSDVTKESDRNVLVYHSLKFYHHLDMSRAMLSRNTVVELLINTDTYMSQIRNTKKGGTISTRSRGRFSCLLGTAFKEWTLFHGPYHKSLYLCTRNSGNAFFVTRSGIVMQMKPGYYFKIAFLIDWEVLSS